MGNRNSSIVGTLMRLPAIINDITLPDIWITGGHLLGGTMGAVGFIAGFVWIIQGIFSPKRVGIVAILFYIYQALQLRTIFTSKSLR